MSSNQSKPKRTEHDLANTRIAQRDLRKLAAKIKHHREVRGWSLEMLAKKAKISYQQLSHLERCDNGISLHALFSLCRVLKLGTPPLV